MIIEEYIIIGIGYRNLNHFKKLGYDAKFGDDISVLSTHLSETSNTIIHAKCDSCGEETELKKTNYTKSLKCHNYYCCQKCSIDKITKTNLEKYGVENTFQYDKFKEKIKITNLINLGVENPQQSDEIKKKTSKTNFERYGTEYTFQSEEIKDKIKKTLLIKYGVEHPMKSEEIKNKIKKTNLDRYGVECVASSEKFKKSIFNRYGVEYVIHPMQNDKIFEKTLKNSYQTKYFNNLKYKGTYELNFIKRYEYLNIQNCKSIDYFYDDKKENIFQIFIMKKKI